MATNFPRHALVKSCEGFNFKVGKAMDETMHPRHKSSDLDFMIFLDAWIGYETMFASGSV